MDWRRTVATLPVRTLGQRLHLHALQDEETQESVAVKKIENAPLGEDA